MIFGDLEHHPDARTLPQFLIPRPNEGLFFANAAGLQDEIMRRVQQADPPARAVVLDLEITYDLDVPSCDMLAELKQDLDAAGVQLMLARVHPDVKDILVRSRTTDVIGAEQMHPRVLEAALSFIIDKKDSFEPGDLETLNDFIDLIIETFSSLSAFDSPEAQQASAAAIERLSDFRRSLDPDRE